MQTHRRELFTTIHTEGSIIPPDLLRRIGDGDAGLPGLNASDYHLAAYERLSEAINRSWNRLVGAWTGFQEARELLSIGDVGTSLTRERWLLILFQELGYGRLQTARAISLDGKSYAVSHTWGAVPVHLVGVRVPLDRRTAGVAGAAGQSPHGLVQELLNRDDGRLWGFVSNGLALRVLRDNSTLTRQAFVEFDLESMMDGEVYSDFVVLWLLCHQSRVEADHLEQYWIERWSRAAAEQGTRALEALRGGVEKAIAALGRGFLAHRTNTPLRDSLRSGDLSTFDYYRQLLRLVYRLLFLFVAEDRNILLSPDANPAARARYERFYSTQRLRKLAQRHRGGKHTDLYAALQIVMTKLGADDGCAELALPALGSFLWSTAAIPDLAAAALGNADLLEAVRELAFLEERGANQRAVDYKNLGSEELGSVYESLLELHPELNIDAATFELCTAAGHERKATGSYYTPSTLISALLDSTVDPILQDAVRATDPETAILELKICDPACGSGHFLVAAAQRLAKRLASIRTGDDEPSPEALRCALRDVVSNCLYGVDVNPMAVELCKVALWMEALDPGRPLSFLDGHIKCGNSLLGTTPELLAAGIPDAAFTALDGDDRDAVNDLRRQNRREREGQFTLAEEVTHLEAVLAAGAEAIETVPDSSIEAIHRKEAQLLTLTSSAEYAEAKLLADTWCAAFVVEKRRSAPQITHALLREIARGGANPDAVAEVSRLAAGYRFFHWRIEFPSVFERDAHGFDAVLGNPPWERIKVEEKEFFSSTSPEIADARNASERKQLIAALAADDPTLLASYRGARRRVDGQGHLFRNSGRFPLCGRGDVNTYAVFAEAMRGIVGATGRAGCVVPSGIATDATTAPFFADLVNSSSLVSLFDFRNHDRFFRDVGHRRFKFCLLTMSGSARPVPASEFVFWAEDTANLDDPDRRYSLTADDLRVLNPNTGTCPTFRSRRDAELTKGIYERVPILVRRGTADENAWGVSFLRLFDMANDSALFLREPGTDRLPLYEAKMIHQFNHRFGDYAMRKAGSRDTQLPDIPLRLLRDPAYAPRPKYWIRAADAEARLARRWSRDWYVAFRDVTFSANERTMISTILSRVGAGHTLPLLLVERIELAACLLANLNAFVLDFTARQKLGGTHMAYFVLEQLPVLPPDSYERAAPWHTSQSLAEWLQPRVIELVFTAYDVAGFARDHDYDGAPFRWNDDRRQMIQAEIDAAFFHLYGLGREDVDHVMESFPIVRRGDEAAHSDYRTKRLILDRFDAMSRAITTQQPYETILHPPAADASAAHAPDDVWREGNEVITFPFRRIGDPPVAERYRTHVPIYSLSAAAGAFPSAIAVEPNGWAQLDGHHSLRPGMFVAQVRGRSMEPRIPDGAWCLFEGPAPNLEDGQIVLVQHRGIDDPETGGSYTVKRYATRSTSADDQLWKREQIILEPINNDYEPILLRDVDDGEFCVVAELVDVLGT